jgi:Schlafen, AlbA_2
VIVSETFLDALTVALNNAALYNRYDQVAPAAIMWLDAGREWELLAPRLRERIPFYTVGPYNANELSGPAIWVRCMLGHALPETPPLDGIPVIYFPGISTQQLRLVSQNDKTLQPLADLYYRGVVWAQRDGQDWTIPALLKSTESGFGIDVLTDEATRKAIRRSLPRLAEMEVSQLREGAPWKAADLDALLGFKTEPSLRDLIAKGEGDTLEFKATARWDVDNGVKSTKMEQIVLKTVGAFLNSPHGGTLLIGVEDNGAVRGLEEDYQAFKPEDRNRDGYELWLMDKLLNTFGRDCIPHLRIGFHSESDKEVCQVSVLPGHKPVFVKEGSETRFYVRTGNDSSPLALKDAVEYSIRRWGAPIRHAARTAND